MKFKGLSFTQSYYSRWIIRYCKQGAVVNFFPLCFGWYCQRSIMLILLILLKLRGLQVKYLQKPLFNSWQSGVYHLHLWEVSAMMASMAGAISSCSTIIRQTNPLAVYHHCSAHRLNLADLSACKIPAFRNTESSLVHDGKIFQFSAKDVFLTKLAIDAACPAAHAKKLKGTCKTRWIQYIIEHLPALHINGFSCQLWGNGQWLELEWRNCYQGLDLSISWSLLPSWFVCKFS